MPKKRLGAEQIVTKLRQVEVLQSQGKSVAAVCKEAGLSGLQRSRDKLGDLRKGEFLAHRSSAVHLVVGELGRCDRRNPISIWPSRSPVRTLAPSFLQPLIPLPPLLRLTPRSLLLRWHPFRGIAPRQRQQRFPQP